MYREHFGLVRDPFNVTPDPAFLYLSRSHQEALAQLVYGVKSRKGFVVLTGEVGTGKTTLLHALLHELNGNAQTAFIFNTIANQKDLLRTVCEDFRLTAPETEAKEIHDYISLLNRFLLESYQKGGNCVLIIDEAQNLSAEVLDSVRLLSNFETAEDKLLQILMVGQPELSARLNAPQLRQVKQRVALRHNLRPLTLTECIEYVGRRLEIAGGTPSIFTGAALRTIYAYSGGTPRVINILCDNSMLTAYALNRKRVEEYMIREVAEDLSLPVPESIRRTTVEAAIKRGRAIEEPSGTEKRRRWLGTAAWSLAAVLMLGALYWATDWNRTENLDPAKLVDFLKSIYEEIKTSL
jgi:general secretion pathway protein A